MGETAVEQDPLYAGYAQHKGWASQEFEVNVEYYDALWKAAGFGERLRVLELGFGAGAFLDWARTRGHAPVGVDILPDMLAATRARGHDVRLGPLSRTTFTGERFDIVCALDVFEHLEVAEIHDYLGICLGLLDGAPGILLRFPNGSSPLSARYQNADVTHKSILSLGVMKQIAAAHGLVARELTHRPYPSGLAGRLRRAFVYGSRDLISATIGLACFGHTINLDPNLVVLLTTADA